MLCVKIKFKHKGELVKWLGRSNKSEGCRFESFTG